MTEPLEDEEQKALALHLNRLGVLWCHVPNGGKRSARVGAELKRQGVKRGVPDVLIFTSLRGEKGTAIELKRQTKGVVSSEQKKWLEGLRREGWNVYVAHGWEAARDYLTTMGFEEERS